MKVCDQNSKRKSPRSHPSQNSIAICSQTCHFNWRKGNLFVYCDADFNFPPSPCISFPLTLSSRVSSSFSRFSAIFSIKIHSLFLAPHLSTSVPPSLYHTLTQRPMFRRNPILSLFKICCSISQPFCHTAVHTQYPLLPHSNPFSPSPKTHKHTLAGECTQR